MVKNLLKRITDNRENAITLIPPGQNVALISKKLYLHVITIERAISKTSLFLLNG